MSRGVAAAAFPTVIDRAQMGACVQAHASELINYKKETEGKIKMKIPMKEKVDKIFYRRDDDYGNGRNAADGLSIATYQHEDAIMQASGQHVYILHVEMTAAARDQVGMQFPNNIRTFHDFA